MTKRVIRVALGFVWWPVLIGLTACGNPVVVDYDGGTVRLDDITGRIKGKKMIIKKAIAKKAALKKKIETVYLQKGIEKETAFKRRIERKIREIISSKLLSDTLGKTSQPTARDIRAYGEQVKVRYLLVPYNKNVMKYDPQHRKEKALAERIRKLARSGTDFAALVRRYSGDKKTRENNGVLGFFNRFQMEKEFTDQVFRLEEGEISPVIPVKDGFALVKMLERKQVEVPRQGRKYRQMMEEIGQYKYMKAYQEYIDRLRAEYRDRYRLNLAPIGLNIVPKHTVLLRFLDTEYTFGDLQYDIRHTDRRLEVKTAAQKKQYVRDKVLVSLLLEQRAVERKYLKRPEIQEAILNARREVIYQLVQMKDLGGGSEKEQKEKFKRYLAERNISPSSAAAEQLRRRFYQRESRRRKAEWIEKKMEEYNIRVYPDRLFPERNHLYYHYRARQAFQNEAYKKAVKRLNQALNEDPSHVPSHLLKAHIFVVSGNGERLGEQLRLIEQNFREDPREVVAYYDRLRRQEGKPAASLEKYRSALLTIMTRGHRYVPPNTVTRLFVREKSESAQLKLVSLLMKYEDPRLLRAVKAIRPYALSDQVNSALNRLEAKLLSQRRGASS